MYGQRDVNMANRTPSRAELLEIRREREMIGDGLRFLDEKRALIGQAIMRALDDYAAITRSFADLQARAFRALSNAFGWHGLEELQVYPRRSLDAATVRARMTSFLGVRLLEGAELVVELGNNEPGPWPSLPSPIADHCRDLFVELTQEAARLAALSGNLVRLIDEYRRTERRVHALENVVLPEVEDEESQMRATLDEVDTEDVLRVHLATRRQPTSAL
jgi:V/A-type H+-transporting ATPase subunit D